MPAEIGTTQSAACFGAPGASRSPSTALRTETAGVMIPSP